MKDMRDKLVALISGYTEYISAKELHSAEFDERFTDYLLANGVIVPPCKVGDTVYQTDGVGLYESTIKNIVYETKNIAFDERAIGKTVFLSREEAEAALEERR